MRRIPRQVWIGVIVVAVALCLFEGFRPRHWSFESEASFKAVTQALPTNRAKWQAHNIHDYDVDAKMFFPPICVMGNDSATIHVRNDVVVNVDWHTDLPPQGIEALYVQGCQAEAVIPTGDFNLNINLAYVNPQERYVNAEFDLEFGFMRKYAIEDNNSGAVGECCSNYELSNFKPISQ